MILEYNLFLWKISCFMFLFVNSSEQSEIIFNNQSDDPGKQNNMLNKLYAGAKV
jgi:hypothetical protein